MLPCKCFYHLDCIYVHFGEKTNNKYWIYVKDVPNKQIQCPRSYHSKCKEFPPNIINKETINEVLKRK
jgi:hypothetical protein